MKLINQIALAWQLAVTAEAVTQVSASNFN